MEVSNKNGKKNSGIILAMIGVIVGILLLLVGSFGKSDRDGNASSADEAKGAELDAKAYEEELESRIRELCYGIKGVGNVSVMVSLKGGYKTVYAMDAQASSGGYRSEIVKVGSGSNQDGIITGYENPEIIGVGIVCEGGEDARIKGEIVSLVSAALDISTNKIFVAAGG